MFALAEWAPVRHCILSACSAFYYDFFGRAATAVSSSFFLLFLRKYNESLQVLVNGWIAGWCSSSILIVNAGLASFSKRPIPFDKAEHELYSTSVCCLPPLGSCWLRVGSIAVGYLLLCVYLVSWLFAISLMCSLLLWRSVRKLKLASVKTDEAHLYVRNESIV